jgi:hypothetical protein
MMNLMKDEQAVWFIFDSLINESAIEKWGPQPTGSRAGM